MNAQMDFLFPGTVVQHVGSKEIGVVSEDQSPVPCLAWIYEDGKTINVDRMGMRIPFHRQTLIVVGA